jgi:ribonuclease-3
MQPSDDPTNAPFADATAKVGALPRRPLSELERAIGYRFKKRDYLVNALVHKSYLHEVPDFPLGSNERLEFLGDAVIGFIVSIDLFKSYPDVQEGRLSALRGVLVRLSTLADVGRGIDLGDYLYMSHGEEAAGGRSRTTNIGRAVEALVGAVYLDGGLRAARKVWHRILGSRSIEELQAVLRADYKSQLQQYTQAVLRQTPAYRLVAATGPDHAKEFHMEVRVGDRALARGVGKNKQLAEQAAAAMALRLLIGDQDGQDGDEKSVP